MFTITVVAIQTMNTEYVEFRCTNAQCIVYKSAYVLTICIVYCLKTIPSFYRMLKGELRDNQSAQCCSCQIHFLVNPRGLCGMYTMNGIDSFHANDEIRYGNQCL